MEDSHQDRINTCPFIGSRRDQDTVYGYPSGSNVCHAEGSFRRNLWFFKLGRRPYRHISLHRQKDVCLSEQGWCSCAGYLDASKKA